MSKCAFEAKSRQVGGIPAPAYERGSKPCILPCILPHGFSSCSTLLDTCPSKALQPQLQHWCMVPLPRWGLHMRDQERRWSDHVTDELGLVWSVQVGAERAQLLPVTGRRWEQIHTRPAGRCVAGLPLLVAFNHQVLRPAQKNVRSLLSIRAVLQARKKLVADSEMWFLAGSHPPPCAGVCTENGTSYQSPETQLKRTSVGAFVFIFHRSPTAHKVSLAHWRQEVKLYSVPR